MMRQPLSPASADDRHQCLARTADITAATPKGAQPNVACAASSTTQTLHRAAGSTVGSGSLDPWRVEMLLQWL